ncbi:hypothetical protein ABIC94_000799 [Variovorax paradoxus]|uniref:DUF3592 domain-containing protein n=1 Tax=Variovorax paradoxus TaxID=34073 RepID=UPI003394E9F4
MDEETIQHAMLVFGLSLLVGPAVGGLAGWLKNLFWGVGVGALLIGCAGLYAAATIGWQRYQSIAGTASVQGSLVEFVEERSKDSKGRTTVSRAPVVEYVAADGQTRRVKGLGGGLSDKEWGDPVEVRYSVADPAQALVADFQNMWGAVWGLGLFGLFPTMFGLFFTGMAIKEGRPAGKSRSPVESSATLAQQRWRTRGTVLANLVFLAGFAVCFLYPGESLGKALGAGFMTIGTGALLHFVVQSFPPAMEFEFRSILAIVGLGFLAFGYGAWMMLA